MKTYLTENLQVAICNILRDYRNDRHIDIMDAVTEPDKEIITGITDQLFRIIYPGYFRDRTYRYYEIRNSLTLSIENIAYHLSHQICNSLRNDCIRVRMEDPEFSNQHPAGTDPLSPEEISQMEDRSDRIALEFFNRIPKIREYLDTDLEAFFDGDPAAENRDEIILCYPGFYAITVFRMAHELYSLGVPMLPRIMTEHAHAKTGIDINPGADIGKYFFIDHGTGIVIGETTQIGEHVKIYQGVTLGALSTKGGRKLQNKKRHPTIEDNVTIYSGASILGGDTVIGKNSIIGGNVFLTRSVAADTRVSVKNQELSFDNSKKAGKHVKDADSGLFDLI